MYVPGEENVCVGLRLVDVLLEPEPGSPKLQFQPTGVPVDVSVNVTGVPAAGEDGVNVKLAVGFVPSDPVV